MNRSADSAVDLRSVFGSNGLLANTIPDFRVRERQLEMAAVIASAIDHRASILVEAGTGTGKTFAYLVPLLLAGVRAIVSTGTRTLQDQLYYSDLPRLGSVVERPPRFALLKGRANYLCPYRLERNLDSTRGHVSKKIQSQLVSIRKWQSRTATGDLGEVLDPETAAGLIPLVTSNADNCLGSTCPKLAECPVYRARALAMDADVVVVNHHLLMADLALQDDNISSLLPTVDVIVLDEAHQVPAVARQFAGSHLGSGQLIELCRDVSAEGQLFGGEEFQLVDAAHSLHTATSNLAGLLAARSSTDLSILSEDEGIHAVSLCESALATLANCLAGSEARSRMLANCYQRCLRLLDEFALLTEPGGIDDTHAHWLSHTGSGFTIHLTPVSVAAEFAARVRSGGQSWILTSATLAVSDQFDHIRTELGLSDEAAWRFDSPFDYLQQVKGFVPPNLPAPGTDVHTLALVEIALGLIGANAGRTFMLFTSYRALGIAGKILLEKGIPCVIQGQESRASVLERFTRVPRCVLLGTQSFWEGVDVRGAGLTLLIIDKLPFTQPDDPLMRARIRAAEAEGKNGFMSVQVPAAAINLRQGFGRLIRDEQDAGLFVLGDDRVLTKHYGRMLLASLPPMEWLTSASAAARYLESL
ncbi:MAG: ATP-dependent DNA helicase [Pseudomonadota bacterium]